VAEVERLEYRPDFAKHVVGTYGARVWDAEIGRYEEQRIDMTCEECGAAMRRTCDSGRVREHIARFAIQHLHKDPLRNPGSGGSSQA
jgi:hypothetical protein